MSFNNTYKAAAALVPTSAAAAPTGANTAALAANAAPAAPVTNAAVFLRSPSVGGNTIIISGDIESHDARLRQMGFHRAASIKVANGVGIGATKVSRRSRCPLMPPLKVHHYRGEPRGCRQIL